MRVRAWAVAAVVGLAGLCAPAAAQTFGANTTRQVRLATRIGTNFGTFASQGNRVAFVPGGGIFVAYLAHWTTGDRCVLANGVSRPPTPAQGPRDGCRNEMVVSRSSDQGRTFHVLLRINVGGHAAPVLYADNAGDVIAVFASHMNPNRNDSWVYRFPHGNWAHPTALGAIFYGQASAKFTARISPQNGGTLWYLHAGSAPTAPWGSALMMTRTRIGWGGGSVGATRCANRTSVNCFLPIATNDPEPGNNSGGVFPQYPHLYFDKASQLAVMAWTNSPNCLGSAYYNIHFILSPNRGEDWYGKNGLIPYSSMPIRVGDSGPAWNLLSRNEYIGHACTSLRNWLIDIFVQQGRLYALYRRATGNAWFRRLTLTFNASQGRYTVHNDIGPVHIQGVGNGNGGGSFSGTGLNGARIFLTARNTAGTGVIVKDSTNNGNAWHTFATDPQRVENVYSLSGASRLGPHNDVLAAFTDQRPNRANSEVFFVSNRRP